MGNPEGHYRAEHALMSHESEMTTNPPIAAPRSAAERMRAHRERRQGLRCLVVQVFETIQ
jgi:hypothetical protein